MYLREDQEFGQGGGGAAILRSAGFGHAAVRPRPLLPDFKLAVDLGARIGSPQWLRGLATLGAMVAALVHVSPGISPVPGAGPASFAPAQQDEMRAIGIAPTAYGADSGRRLAPTDRAQPLTSTPERPQIDLAVTLGAGDGLARLLLREGVSQADADAAVALVARAMPVGDVAAGTRIAITLGRRANAGVVRPLDLLSFRARFDLALAAKRVEGRLMLDAQPIAVDETPLRTDGLVGTSLYHAMRSAGVPIDLVAEYLRAIGPHIDLDDIEPGDRFDLVMEHRRAETGEIQTGRLLYAGLQRGDKRLQLLRWSFGGHDQWFDETGAGERRAGFSMPVSGGRLTSGFGLRFHPILGFSRMHQGIDIAAPYGTPIVAASDGVVRFAGWHGGHGNFVQIAHDGGLGTGYGHMSRFVVAPGDRVAQGQLIGYVGMTGLTTGPHVHFEVYRGGTPIDPASADFAATTQITGAELVRFKTRLAKLTALKPGAAVAIQVATK
ncbi:MAG: peptidase [Sphingomonas bacterium]|nr:peptidase [Sphingomonas bacterium]